jgi:uncharacterized protein (DUF1697 family)
MGQSSPPAQRYIAFLRAINVGGHNVKMSQLRDLFAAIECLNVETFIASGNVIFESPDVDIQVLERRIERHLHQSLGYAVATFIRTPAELAAVALYQPFAPAELTAEGNWLYVAFLPVPPAAAAEQKLSTFRTAVDDFHVHEREVYWLRRARMGESTFSGAPLEKTLGLPATMRNITTVKKLAAKYPAE